MTDYRDDTTLRALLDDAVSDVEPAPGLDRIRSRTGTAARRPWVHAAVGAVAATAATVAVVTVVSGNGPDDTAASPATAPSSPASTPAQPTQSPGSPGPTASSEPAGAGLVDTAVPVYYAADTPTGARLFREFHRLTVPAGDQVFSSLEEMLTEKPRDPDYRSLWAGLTQGVASTAAQGGRITVDLTAPGSLRDRPAHLSEEEARMAVQELVYTAQAGLGHGNRVPVQVTVDGQPTDRLLGIPADQPFTAEDPMTVQGPVWITSPEEGAQVGRSFTVEGRGAFFEANVSWQLLQDGQVVRSGHGTAQECCTLSPYSFRVTGVAPGTYTLRVYDADVSGEGPGEQQDTKDITVR